MDDDLIAELRRRLARQPPERYPIQHATTSFHLGTALLQGGDVSGSIDAFTRSVALFEPLPLERGKASNMLGIALREANRIDDAAGAFAEAASAFAASAATAEEAAARYNLGLAHAQQGGVASVELAAALELFRTAGATRQEAAAARELGQALLVEGRVDEALEVLDAAVSAAQACGDVAGAGGAANALGLAQLAAGAPALAAEAFRMARAAHPRSLRPSQHAMAVGNLALALERCGELLGARLAARQARAVPGVDQRVIEQCEALLARSGDTDAELVPVLHQGPEEQWPVLLRDELERWADEAERERTPAARSLAAELARDGASDDLAEAVLRAALELPPGRVEVVVSAISRAVDGLDEESSDRGRARLARAAARFPLPQMLRLEALLHPPTPAAEDG